MKNLLLLATTISLISLSALGQETMPKGASNFFTERGGLSFSSGKADILQQVAGNNIDKVEAGGGIEDWIKLDGRVFVRAAWMVEIGEFKDDYGSYDLKQALAAEMQKRLLAEGFILTAKKFDFNYVRYQKGSTVDTIEVRSFFLNNGNLPLRIEFIFNESYRPVVKIKRKQIVLKPETATSDYEKRNQIGTLVDQRSSKNSQNVNIKIRYGS